MSVADPAKEQIKQILLDHKGADNPISSREINEQVQLDNIGSFPVVREVIRELVLEDQIPIVATNQGYFLLQSEEELDTYVETLESRVMQITERKFAILRAADQWDGKIDEDESDSDLL